MSRQSAVRADNRKVVRFLLHLLCAFVGEIALFQGIISFSPYSECGVVCVDTWSSGGAACQRL